jgi:glycerol-3-phosphate dehydrogenase subunit B
VKRVLVVGGGVAGTAAALSAARAGAHVSLVAAGSGASTLSGGAIDVEPWESSRAPVAPLAPDEGAVVEAIDLFRVGDVGVVVATLAGILRPARGADRALLDLAPLHDAEVLVPLVDWPTWDATALARSWNDAAEARARRITFTTTPVPMVQKRAEHDLGDADMARLHDAPERLDWLAARLTSAMKARAGRGVAAILLPAWLGLDRPRAASLKDRIGVPCGEAMAGAGGPSGLRFENARDRALTAAGVERVSGRVVALACAGTWSTALESGESIDAVDAVVLATGGLLGGGLAYSPIASILAAEPHAVAAPLVHATLDAPLVVGMNGLALEAPSSLFGGAPEAHAWPYVQEPLLERAGVLVDAEGRVRGAPAGLYAAGEMAADRPRTWLDALSLGVRAGRAAAR